MKSSFPHAPSCIGFVCTCDPVHLYARRLSGRLQRAIYRAMIKTPPLEWMDRVHRILMHAQDLGWLAPNPSAPAYPYEIKADSRQLNSTSRACPAIEFTVPVESLDS